MANNWRYRKINHYKAVDGSSAIYDNSEYNIYDGGDRCVCKVFDEQTAKDIVAGIEALERLKKFVPDNQTAKQVNIDQSPQIGKWEYRIGIIPHKSAGEADKIVYNLFDEEKRFVAGVQHEGVAQAIVEDVNKAINKTTCEKQVSKFIKDWKEYRNIPPTNATLAESIKKTLDEYYKRIAKNVIEALTKDPIA